jgi:hypothetical protein
MFGRKKADPHSAAPQSTTLISGPYTGVLPADQVPARLWVGAVTPPGRPLAGDAVLVSGILLGVFQVVLVQVTAALPRASWPTPGQELPAVADPADPMHFAVVWSSGAQADGTSAPADPAQWNHSGLTGWDGGPGGAHTQAVAEWLAANGFVPGDFGPALGQISPELPAVLYAACARYSTVIAGHDALALMSTGLPAQGVVAAMTPLHMPVEMLPSPSASMAWLTLEVTPPGGDPGLLDARDRADQRGTDQRRADQRGADVLEQAGAPYRCTIRFGFRSPERLAALATVGTRLPLRVDPADRSRVTIDLPALGIVPG